MTDTTQKNDGGPAFPQVIPTVGNNTIGMTIRQWYAGMAMAALLPNEENSYESAAIGAVVAADALIAELEKPKRGMR